MTDSLLDRVLVIDPATDSLVTTVPVGDEPNGLAVTPDGGRVLVVNRDSDSVSVIETATHTVVATVAVGDLPRDVAVLPDGSRAYVTNDNSNSVSVIDTATLAVTGTVSVGRGPNGITVTADGAAVTADGTRVYVAAGADGRIWWIWWIDTATESVLGFLAVGGRPFRVGAGPPAVIRVAIDVKPASFPNCFNLDGHGVIPVAILGAGDFDVVSIDPGSLLFDGLRVRVRGQRGPLCSFEDANEDTFLDLVCHFEDEPENWTAGSDTATLAGALFDDRRIEGRDSICTVG